MSKREALVDTAKKLLWVRGDPAMSPRDVQSASGAGQGSMYRHFSGKLIWPQRRLLKLKRKFMLFDGFSTPTLRARSDTNLSLNAFGPRSSLGALGK